VEPNVFHQPGVCPYAKCGGQRFHLRQEVRKAVRDTVYTEVTARRYDCLRCGRTFRVYPVGVTDDQVSRRLKGLAVLFYIMGLSYGAVALVLSALGHPLGKTAVYNTVQAAGAKVAGLRREEVRLSTVRTLVAALGADVTSVKCQGEWLTVGVTTDAIAGTTLTIDLLDNAEADTLQKWVEEVAEAVHAVVLVTDDADGSLAEIGVAPAQALADNDELLRLVQERQPTPAANAKLEEIHSRYAQARSARKLGQDKETLAYRMRLFSLDRWNLWPRLTLYRRWRGAHDERLDGTNNATERAIGWRVKERYRTMRGYKRKASVLNVSRLIAWAGNLLDGDGADLAEVIA
jgi:hypothetical protein